MGRNNQSKTGRKYDKEKNAGESKREKTEKRRARLKTVLAIVLAIMLIVGTLSPLLAVFGQDESDINPANPTGNSDFSNCDRSKEISLGTSVAEKSTRSDSRKGGAQDAGRKGVGREKGVRANPRNYENFYAVVLEVLPLNEGAETGKIPPVSQSSRVMQRLTVRITSPGSYENLEVEAEFERNAFFNEKYLLAELKPGDHVVLHAELDKYGAIAKVYVADIQRQGLLLWLTALFFFCLLLVGGWKGLKAIFSLILTGVMVFFVFIPLLLKGYHPVILSISVCIVVISLSFLIISGWNRKTAAATSGTVVGIVIAGLLFLLFSALMKISGVANEHAKMLIFSAQQIQIDLKGLLFAGVLIASMGASMDIGMTVASTVNEVGINSPEISRFALFKAGLNVGRDAMATMTNTLILAYTGTSLNLILLLSVNSIRPIAFLNWEILAIEITRALTATIGLVSAIPVTAFIAAELFDKKRTR